MTNLAAATVTFEHILVPADFSDASQRAPAYAKNIARHSQSQLFLAHVNEPINPVTLPAPVWIDQEGI